MRKIDWYQARSIIINTLRQEIRPKSKLKKSSGFWSTAIMMLFLGIFSAIVSRFFSDAFTSAFFLVAPLMAFIGNFILIEFHVIATGPEDYNFFASRPVSDSTYLFSKLLSILILILLFSAIFFIPILIINIIKNAAPPVIIGYCYTVFIGSITMSLLILSLFSILNRYVPYKAIRNVTSIVQFILFLGLLLGVNILIQQAGDGTLNIEIPADSPLIFLPNGWAAALFALKDGTVVPYFAVIIPFVLGAFLLRYVKNVISLNYASKFAVENISTANKKNNKNPSIRFRFWRQSESQAFIILLNKLIRHNTQIRSSFLMIFPLTVFYFIMVLFINNEPISDPFTDAGRENFLSTANLYIMFSIIPLLVKNALTYSTEKSASWIFFSAPIKRIKLIDTARTFLLMFFVIPYTLIIFSVFVSFTGALFHSIQHFLVIMLILLILIDILLYYFPEIPFSKDYKRGQNGAVIFFRVIAVIIIFPQVLNFLVTVMYQSAAAYWSGIGILFVLWFGVHILGKLYADKVLRQKDFSV